MSSRASKQARGSARKGYARRGVFGFALCAGALVLPNAASAQSGRAMVSAVYEAVGETDRVASGFCRDEIADIVRIDGRLDLQEPRRIPGACSALLDSPGPWLRCMFTEAPMMTVHVAVEVVGVAYTLSATFVTEDGQSLRHEATVDGELQSLLVRCRRHGFVLVEALFGDVRVTDEDMLSSRTLRRNDSAERSLYADWLRPRTTESRMYDVYLRNEQGPGAGGDLRPYAPAPGTSSTVRTWVDGVPVGERSYFTGRPNQPAYFAPPQGHSNR